VYVNSPVPSGLFPSLEIGCGVTKCAVNSEMINNPKAEDSIEEDVISIALKLERKRK